MLVEGHLFNQDINGVPAVVNLVRYRTKRLDVASVA